MVKIDSNNLILFSDNLCREHDVDYLLGVSPEIADARLLQGMWSLKHPLLPLFVAVFEAKRYYESIVGDKYTSALYYFPEGHKSLTFFVSKSSVYDATTHALDEESRAFGLHLEERWMKILHDIWSGHCYSSALPPIIELVGFP